jgi:hypothetical protein
MPRGTILRDTSLGSGLIAIAGQQYPFSLEGVWKSDVPPAAGMRVDVELDEGGNVAGVATVPESQIVREQAELALASARANGGRLAAGALARFGVHNLAAAGILLLGWFMLAAISIQTPLGRLDYTFWQVLGFVNASNPLEVLMQGGRGTGSAGIYGFLALVALAGPFWSYFWKDRRAALGGLLPLLFMLAVGYLLRQSVSSLAGESGAGGALQEMAEQAGQEMMKAISLGSGSYVAIVASLYFAAVAIRRTLLRNP